MADRVLAGVLVVAAVVALRLVRRPTPLLLRLTVLGAVLALARGVPALAVDLATGDLSGVGLFAEVWFTVAGLLGLLLWRRVRSGTRAAR